MGVPQNEVAADNQRRKMEEIASSPVGGIIEGAVSLAGPAVALGTAVVVAGGTCPVGLVAAGGVVAGAGIVDWFRKLGTSKVNDNLEVLAHATEDALNRVENTLREHGVSIAEISRRLNSDEFRNAMATASLQALRTTQQGRLTRLALILSNGVLASHSSAESIDDMMRAAVELKDADIALLGEIYAMQSPFMNTPGWIDKQIADKWNILSGYWQKYWTENQSKYAGQPGMILMGSFARLESLGMIAPGPNRSSAMSPVAQCYFLLPDGARFYEWLQEVADKQ